MRSSIRYGLILVCCLLVHAHTAEAQFLNPKIRENKVAIRTATLLPAKVELTKESAKGSEMMVAESAELSTGVMDAVTQTLQKKKINVVENSFTQSELDESRKYTLADIQARYDAILPKLIDKSKDVKKARFTLGDEVMLLNVHKDADVIVFIRGQGRVFTKGKTAFSIINIFDFDFPFTMITVGIVDARSGEVLAFTRPFSASGVVKDKKKLTKMIEKSLKKLPPPAG